MQFSEPPNPMLTSDQVTAQLPVRGLKVWVPPPKADCDLQIGCQSAHSNNMEFTIIMPCKVGSY
jgi:hypothetical protein